MQKSPPNSSSSAFTSSIFEGQIERGANDAGVDVELYCSRAVRGRGHARERAPPLDAHPMHRHGSYWARERCCCCYPWPMASAVVRWAREHWFSVPCVRCHGPHAHCRGTELARYRVEPACASPTDALTRMRAATRAPLHASRSRVLATCVFALLRPDCLPRRHVPLAFSRPAPS